MKILSKQIHNTGGGCMVLFIEVEQFGDVTLVTANEESMVGHSCSFADWWEGEIDLHDSSMWIARDYDELLDAVGSDAAEELFKVYNRNWLWHNMFRTGGDE